jgi:Protein of unknown function (DUF3500)
MREAVTMKQIWRGGLALATLAFLAGVGLIAQERQPAGSRMASTAQAFLALLNPEQRAAATFPFDDPERVNWDFVPLQDEQKNSKRKGLRLEKMTPEQRNAALGVLRSALSPGGFESASTIMSFENLLAELEAGGAMVRNPGWYFVTVFGEPSQTAKWGFRFEGHHLTVNITLDGGNIISTTPTVFGSNPAVVLDGPRKGAKPIFAVDQVAKDLIGALSEDQKKVAFQEKQFPEIKTHTKAPKADKPVGLTLKQMDEKQKELLIKLARTYAERMPEDVAAKNMAAVTSAPPDEIYFAYAGKFEQGQPHTYRVQGPTFVIEFLNVQADSAKNPANHIHSGWRTLAGDFGLVQ